nr:Rpn family recombination-promoting nuclease/putative transposase [uncultured Intestinibacter sp.]
MRGLLDPKMDFVFKNIFGSEKHPNILISFLNATLKPKDLITAVEIKNTDLNKGYIEDKFSRLDVKATTSNNEIINIEIQLKNEYNMIKRSLFYWSKLYSEQLIRMSNDDTQRELYEIRAKTLKDKISALNEAERKGIKKGRQEGIKEGEKSKAIEIAKSLINIGLDKETISKSTGLTLSEIEKLID